MGRVPDVGTPSEKPPISDTPYGEKGGTTRPVSSLGERQFLRLSWLFSFRPRLLLGAHPLAPFAEPFKPPLRPAASLPSLRYSSYRGNRARYFGTNVYGRIHGGVGEGEGVSRRRLKNVNFSSNLSGTYVLNWSRTRVIWPKRPYLSL